MEECPICSSLLEEAEKEVVFESDGGLELTVLVGAQWCPDCDYYEIKDVT